MNHKQQLDALYQQVNQMTVEDASIALHGLLGWFSAIAGNLDDDQYGPASEKQQQEAHAFVEFIKGLEESIKFRLCPEGFAQHNALPGQLEQPPLSEKSPQ